MKKLYLLIPTLFLILNFSTASNSDDFANKSKNPEFLGFPASKQVLDYSAATDSLKSMKVEHMATYFGDVKKGKASGQGSFEFGFGMPFDMDNASYPTDQVFITANTKVSNQYVGGVKNNKPHGKGAISLDLGDKKATFTGNFKYGIMTIDLKQWLQQGGTKHPKDIRMDAVLNPEALGRETLMDKYSDKEKNGIHVMDIALTKLTINKKPDELTTMNRGGFLIQPKMKVKGKWYPAKKINDDLWELTELGFNMYKKDNKLKPEGDGM